MSIDPIRLVTDRLSLPSPEWRRDEFAGEAELWLDAGIIVPSVRRNYVKCTCGLPHTVEVDCIKLQGKTRFMATCPETGCSWEVSKDECVGYKFNVVEMVRLLARLFKCKGKIQEVITGRLWKIEKSGVPVAKRSRDIYFTPTPGEDYLALFNALPKTKTPLLIVGHSVFYKNLSSEATITDNRIIPLEAVLDISKGDWKLDLECLDDRVEDELEKAPARKQQSSTTKKRIIAFLLADLDMAHSKLTHKSAPKFLPPPDMKDLVRFVRVGRSEISRIIQPRTNAEKCEDPVIKVLWQTRTNEDALYRWNRDKKRFRNYRELENEDDGDGFPYDETKPKGWAALG